MMKTLITIFSFWLFANLAICQSSLINSDDDAVITWENDIHDFGKIKKNKPVSVSYGFKNDGLIPILITSVESSCGCTVPEYPRTPVKPLHSSEIIATYDAKTLGVFSKSISVKTNASEKPKVLILKGEVIQ
ncbi:MAG: DUF1573 domain-containing protein [Bacteroidota bacterium]